MSLETTAGCGPNPQRGANTNSLSDRAGADVTPNKVAGKLSVLLESEKP